MQYRAIFKGGGRFTGSTPPPEIITRNFFHCIKITCSIISGLWCLARSLWNSRKSHLACTKCNKPLGGRGSAPDPAGGAYSAPPDPLAGGEGAAPPQEPHLHSRPFRPRASALWASPLPAPNFQTHSEVKSYIRPGAMHCREYRSLPWSTIFQIFHENSPDRQTDRQTNKRIRIHTQCSSTSEQISS